MCELNEERNGTAYKRKQAQKILFVYNVILFSEKGMMFLDREVILLFSHFSI